MPSVFSIKDLVAEIHIPQKPHKEHEHNSNDDPSRPAEPRCEAQELHTGIFQGG